MTKGDIYFMATFVGWVACGLSVWVVMFIDLRLDWPRFHLHPLDDDERLALKLFPLCGPFIFLVIAEVTWERYCAKKEEHHRACQEFLDELRHNDLQD